MVGAEKSRSLISAQRILSRIRPDSGGRADIFFLEMLLMADSSHQDRRLLLTNLNLRVLAGRVFWAEAGGGDA